MWRRWHCFAVPCLACLGCSCLGSPCIEVLIFANSQKNFSWYFCSFLLLPQTQASWGSLVVSSGSNCLCWFLSGDCRVNWIACADGYVWEQEVFDGPHLQTILLPQKRVDVVDCLTAPKANWSLGLYNLEFIKLLVVKSSFCGTSGEAPEWLSWNFEVCFLASIMWVTHFL